MCVCVIVIIYMDDLCMFVCVWVQAWTFIVPYYWRYIGEQCDETYSFNWIGLKQTDGQSVSPLYNGADDDVSIAATNNKQTQT